MTEIISINNYFLGRTIFVVSLSRTLEFIPVKILIVRIKYEFFAIFTNNTDEMSF